jgi:hypothetical protein
MKKTGILFLVCAPTLVLAQEQCALGHVHEKSAPFLTVHTDMRIYAEQVYDASDPDEEIFALKTHSHMNIEFSPVENLFVRSSLKLEKQHSHDHGEHAEDHDDPAEDQYFEDHSLILEELTLVYAPRNLEMFGGKFNPTTSLDQHDIPGWYGYAVEEAYSILGRIGAGVAYTVDTEMFGSHRLEISSFFRDTTPLNQSILHGNNEPDSKNEGGIANTQDFSSWAISLAGEPLYKAIGDTIHELRYVLAYARQDAGYGADSYHKNEDRFVMGGVYTVTFSENLQLKSVLEFKDFRNYQTHADNDLHMSTVGMSLFWKGWELGGSYSKLDHSDEPDGELIQASLGYLWASGLGISGGWKLENSGEEKTKSAGLMVSYHTHF